MLTDSKLTAKIQQLERTYDALRYAVVAGLSLEGADVRETYRNVPPESAGLRWQAVSRGDGWGDSWKTRWFRTTFAVPQAANGLPLFVRIETGAPEAMLLVDGVARGMFDPNHPVRLLTTQAVAGQVHTLHLEAYAGHNFPGTQPFEGFGLLNDAAVQVTPRGRKLGRAELLIERADVSAFVFELRALHQLAAALDENDLRRGRIQAALARVFAEVYAKPEEADEADWRPALARARERMAPLLASPAAPTTPTIGIVGHSHIDTAWLWPIGETWRKLARTFSSVLSLMEQYPDFKFTQSAAYHSEMVRQLYPEIFERVKQRVAEGRWEINGAMWVEPDCNIPNGESFVRQCLFGQRFTRQHFGVTSDTLWQPDVFGYSAALPQILRQSGVQFFCTTKLSWNDTNKFPYDTFNWEGIDGTSVLTHFNVIHCWPDPKTLLETWRAVQHKDVQDRRLMAFGFGDGGGGPMAEMIEMGRLCANLEGSPKAEYTTITRFMQGCRDELCALPKYVGELYLELHRGTLTSIAPIKRGNRLCEVALHDAELMSVIATILARRPYPRESINEAWKILLLNQFHDILPGSSIAEVNDQAIAELADCRARADAIYADAAAAVAGDGSSVMLFNGLSWPRTGEIELARIPDGKAVDGEGVVTQGYENVHGERKVAVAGITLPPLGFATATLVDAPKSVAAPGFKIGTDSVVTPFARVTFDSSTGEITSFFDTVADRDLVRAGGAFNRLLLGEDVPAAWDNWDIDRDQRLKLNPLTTLTSRTIVANGPLQLRIRLEYAVGRSSTLVQDVVFHSKTPRVDFETKVDWHEKYQLLKTAFSVDVLATTARHEIQYGHLTRNTHDNTTIDRAQFDVCAHKWTDISEEGYGVAFLNDCKYGCTVKDGEYRLTLIKSGRHPDARGDQGQHRFAYAVLPHASGFDVPSVVHPAYEFNNPVRVSPASPNAPKSFSLATADQDNVIIESVKLAEDSDAVVLRLYEAGRRRVRSNVRLNVPAESVAEVNLLEEPQSGFNTPVDGVPLLMRPFEIKTLLCACG